MKILEHTGGDSKRNEIEIEPTASQLCAAINKSLEWSGFQATESGIAIKPFGCADAEYPYIVMVDKYGVWGYADSTLK